MPSGGPALIVKHTMLPEPDELRITTFSSGSVTDSGPSKPAGGPAKQGDHTQRGLERVAHGGVHRREDSTHAASLLGSMETRSARVGDAEKLPVRRDQHERARGVITC